MLCKKKTISKYLKEKLKNSFYFTLVIFLIIFVFNIRLNVSNSIPKGIYHISIYNNGKYKKDDYVIFEEPEEYKKYVVEQLRDLPSAKRIRGVPGDVVEIKDDYIYINNQIEGKIDFNIPVKIKEKYTLKDGEYILLGENDNSLDSRYYGVIKKENILDKAYLLVRIYENK